MARKKDVNWNLPEENSYPVVHSALLMDIRDELKKLNGILGCHNFLDVPNILRGIRKKIPARKRRLSTKRAR